VSLPEVDYENTFGTIHDGVFPFDIIPHLKRNVYIFKVVTNPCSITMTSTYSGTRCHEIAYIPLIEGDRNWIPVIYSSVGITDRHPHMLVPIKVAELDTQIIVIST